MILKKKRDNIDAKQVTLKQKETDKIEGKRAR